ncbi:MAG TPA: type II secretion system F family protein [Candidatus Magasanikbacteria bacterium]|nr:type II secretion system F family protein [Candidatus Magasanikbacteria bacterium]
MSEKTVKSSWFKKITSHLETIKFSQKIFLFENLRVMIKAGLSIIESLSIAASQATSPKLKNIVSQVQAEVEKGRPLSETLEKFPQLFPSIYVKMIAAGEISGKLDESLSQAVEQMKKTNSINSKIKGAMVYPIVILVAILGISIEMLVYVLPNILTIFTEMNVALPLPTRMLIATSNFLIKYGLVVLAVFIILIIAFIRAKKNLSFARFIDNLILHLPIFGNISRQINLARFSLTLSSLLKSAIPIIDALSITGEVVTNRLFQDALKETAQKIKTGRAISEVLGEYPQLFPPLVTQMIMAGEKSGTLENLLNELSVYYNEEADQILKNISTIIEPVIILILGVVVGGLAVAVIMPMYSLSEAI